jgi:muramoyltetrapeptide carboxypeptidase
VALVAPAGPLAEGAVERAVERVERWGWEPLVGQHAGGRHGYLAAPDAERARDLNEALTAPHVDAVWCLRGGYGTMRLLGDIDFGRVRVHPRALIGFSDITALHLALQNEGVVSFHGPHPATEEFSDYSAACLHRLLTSCEPLGPLPFPPGGPERAQTLTGGVAEGRLVGGNLSLIAATLGTPYAIRSEGALLFLEEVGEPAYRADRLLTHLLLAGVLQAAAGVVVGAFSDPPADERPGTPSLDEVVAERLAGLGIPVALGFPFGHVAENATLPLGIRARLDATAGTLEYLEAAVRDG